MKAEGERRVNMAEGRAEGQRRIEAFESAVLSGEGAPERVADIERELRVMQQVAGLPQTVFTGANRYDTDNEHVLHLWTASGESYDVRWPKESV